MSQTIDSIVNFLQDQAEDALKSARETTLRIHSVLDPALSTTPLEFDVKKPALSAPPTFSDLFPGADGTSAEVIRLNAEVEEWLAKYFPEMTASLRDTPEQWACGILTGQNPFGLDPAVFEAVWHEGRDRAYRAAASESATIYAEFSERGFSLPIGTMVGLRSAAELRAGQAIADLNRTETTRAAEIKLDLLKFAEEQAVRLKLGIMDALRAFYTTWITLPDKDIERARVRTQAQASLYSALSSYYNVELGFEELRLKAAELETQTNLNIDRNKIDALRTSRSSDALASAVRGFADISASASNAQSALVAEITAG